MKIKKSKKAMAMEQLLTVGIWIAVAVMLLFAVVYIIKGLGG